ncbi:group II intron reverse transcriptase/maturase [Candidatus Epulonipiscium fishelsonii]|uniref:Group II intron reverse transcriptase/maturase n=1 Tax=Candidatus Epulonipiscium fishelsonii TaxID=77094 RepID=A0ACC8XC87_9FIRM|nr:group II intron reverse transcriptase/maturase [Epulopiscium sp. SCG-B11WGA-EpuloA1]ONI41353.1 group II intron reverse transcriptase/maturase [Epulopiscium sp. SCG-B05WGA-EpuloA1]
MEKKSFLKLQLKSMKKNILRFNEYYNSKHILDNLYRQSLQGCKFNKLYNLIIRDENILLAYRTIKTNSGSKTGGVNNHTIEYWEHKTVEEFLNYIKARLSDYKPQKVRRVEIPKDNGKVRPLGIPTIEDRIIQQCIKQVLEPICEAKFHPNSYGFRPNRSTEHAMAYLVKKINLDKNYYLVDIDIAGFFDNVNHGKLIKQMWAIGIQDKKLISILSSMLKAEIDGIGILTKGVPQGGILSPLLSNIVLNELDWWISDQWETYKSRAQYSDNSSKYGHLRKKSNLKEIYIVRYADDFKIACKNKETAEKIFYATKQWLKERLNLNISEEKSSITNLKKANSEYLGFKIKAKRKGNKIVAKTYMTDKAKKKAEENIRNQIKYIQKSNNPYTVYLLNRIIAGLHHYYQMATGVNSDFSKIEHNLSQSRKTRLRSVTTKNGEQSTEYIKKYSHYGGKIIYAMKIAVFPINGVKTKFPKVHNQNVSNYTKDGRKIIHKSLNVNLDMLNYLVHHPVANKSVEYNDNRISLYVAQEGLCAVSQIILDRTIEVHHKTPVNKGGDDKYANLLLVSSSVHKLIHATSENVIKEYSMYLNLNAKQLKKLNKLRKNIGNEIIVNT